MQADAYVSVLDALQSDLQSSTTTSKMYSTALQVILKGLITWIIETSMLSSMSNIFILKFWLIIIKCANKSSIYWFAQRIFFGLKAEISFTFI